jgi:hypothetical protein
MLRIVNMIPRSLSGETAQDSEPNLAVNPENPQQMIATAFTPDPLHGPMAPVFVSNDGGLTWSLRSIVPGGPITGDISVGFGTRGGTLYAGILNISDPEHHPLNVLRTGNPFAPTPMTTLVDRPDEDQPWVSATTVLNGPGTGQDRVFIGHNDFNAGLGTASVESSPDARTAPAPAGFTPKRIEHRPTAGQDGPPIRTAVHSDGTIYAAFQRWSQVVAQVPDWFTDALIDIVVVRDDNWAQGNPGFSDLDDPADSTTGTRVATDRFVRFTGSNGPLGQERIGADLAIAVDPANSSNVWIAWCDRVGGQAGTDWTLHIRRSTDRGRTWSGDDLRTAVNAKNPALAVNADGTVGLLFQQLVGLGSAARWVTQLELTDDGWQGAPTNMVLHTALASDPPRKGLPFLGDYIRLLALGRDFYGVFSGSNLPDPANFPLGVTYQRNANWASHTLLNTDNATPVPHGIDPYFVRYSPER